MHAAIDWGQVMRFVLRGESIAVIAIAPPVFPTIVVTHRVATCDAGETPIHPENLENSNLKALWNSSSHFFANLVS